MNTHPPTRRELLQSTALGFGWLALSDMATRASAAMKQTHFPAKAKRVIFLCMRGAPSHMETFDYKPKLNADNGRPSRREGTKLLGSKWKFSQHGQCGRWISELFPHVAGHADELCLIHSMQTTLPAHPQAYVKLHTGTSQVVRPSLGAWAHFGLGSLNDNLPGFITITPPRGFGGVQNYGSAFLPAIHQGMPVGQENRPISGATVPHLQSRDPQPVQRRELDLVQAINRSKLAREPGNANVEGAIESLELAYRMQSAMPDVMDMSKESEATLKLYGIGERRTDDFGRKCLLARRMVEAGVRFVEVTHGNWDHHFNLDTLLPESCGEVDQPIAGLLEDLRSRGLLQDTLVIWGGEFGRTPHAEGTNGRDHNVGAFMLWMAGGGVKAGYAHGESDEYGYEAVDGKVSITDWHATVLHLLGLNHEKLTFHHAGRDFRLTEVTGTVVSEVVG